MLYCVVVSSSVFVPLVSTVSITIFFPFMLFQIENVFESDAYASSYLSMDRFSKAKLVRHYC